jgi:hypothetical protein
MSGRSKRCTHRRDVFVLISLLALLAPQVRADIALPLQGAYRSRRYMPVRVTASEGMLQGEGMISTSWTGGPSVVPVLIYGSPREIHCSDGSVAAIHPLEDDERIVAFTPDALDASGGMFPGKRRIGVMLDAADLPGPMAAWEAVDAVVLTSEQLTRISQEQRSVLTAAGVLVREAGQRSPDESLPITGPRDQVVDERVFAPTYGWTPEWPPALRGRVMAAGVLVGIAAVALSMWRSRAAVVAVIILSVGATAGVAAWRRALGPVDVGSGDVFVIGEKLMQRDTWVYERAREDEGQRVVPWEGLTHPMFASLSQLERAGMRVTVNVADRKTAFSYNAHRGQTIAFMRRRMQEQYHLYLGAASSPLEPLAKQLYLSPGLSILGFEPETSGNWPTAVVGKSPSP